MDVQLTENQKELLRQAVESGRYQGEEDAVREALSMWEEHELDRAQTIATIENARLSMARGEGRRLAEADLPAFVEEIKQRGRARLAAEAGKGR